MLQDGYEAFLLFARVYGIARRAVTATRAWAIKELTLKNAAKLGSTDGSAAENERLAEETRQALSGIVIHAAQPNPHKQLRANGLRRSGPGGGDDRIACSFGDLGRILHLARTARPDTLQAVVAAVLVFRGTTTW